MPNINQSRHDALVAALKAAYDTRASNRDAAYDALATQILSCIPAFIIITGSPSDQNPPLSVATNFALDQVSGILYYYTGSAWRAITAL